MADEARMDGRERLGRQVALIRSGKFKTVDAARIKAGISRGAWEKVEKGLVVRDYTLRAVEDALGWPQGRAQAIIDGDVSAMLVEIPEDFREWLAATDILSESQRRELLNVMQHMAARNEAIRDVLADAKEADAPQSSPESQSGAGA